MYFLIYSAHPNKKNKADLKYAEAQIACWINTNDREVARIRSRELIEKRNWIIENLTEEHPMTKKMAETSTGLQYYEQALVDGEVLVFVTRPRAEKAKKTRP